MSRFGQFLPAAAGLHVLLAWCAAAPAQGFDPLWFLHNEMRPVKAPLLEAYDTGYAPIYDTAVTQSSYDAGVTQTSHEFLGCLSSDCHRCTDQCHACDACGGCAGSRWGLWRDHLKCLLKRHRWEQGLETCYPVCPPYCAEYYGYRQTCWRRLPPLPPCPPAGGHQIFAPEPGIPPLPQVSPLPPPSGAGLVAPPAPSDLVAPPAPADEFP